MDKNV